MKKLSFCSLLLFFCFFLTIHASADEIHDAAKNGDVAKVKALLNKNPELLHAKTSEGKTPLHMASGWGAG